MTFDWSGRLTEAARRVMRQPRTQSELSQLRAATTLEAIRPASAMMPDFRFTEAGLTDLAYLVRMAELQRPARDRRRQPGALPIIAAAFEDLAARVPAGSPRHIELLAEASSMWSIAGYQANSVVLADRLEREIEALSDQSVPTRVAQLVAALLLRDLAFAERLGREAVAAIPELASTMLTEGDDEGVTLDDAAVLAAYGLIGQAAVDAVQFWRYGDEGARGAAARAVATVERAARLLLDANIVDTWLLADNLRIVLTDAFAASLWRGLRERAPAWNNFWRRHIRIMAEDVRPVVELWPSQRRAIEAGLIDPARTGLVARPIIACIPLTPVPVRDRAEWSPVRPTDLFPTLVARNFTLDIASNVVKLAVERLCNCTRNRRSQDFQSEARHGHIQFLSPMPPRIYVKQISLFRDYCLIAI